MSLPVFDDIVLDEHTTLTDINGLGDDDERLKCQAAALDAWMAETGGAWDEFEAREWDDNEGLFACVVDGTIAGVVIVTDVEAL